MKIAQIYSHLNGLEFIQVHKPALWEEIKAGIAAVNSNHHKTKISNEKKTLGTAFYSPKSMNKAFDGEFNSRGWKSKKTYYWVTSDARVIRKTIPMLRKEQKAEIEKDGLEPLNSFNQTDFVKDRVAVEVQFGKYSFVAYDLFVKHMAFYVGDLIDVGIEILPMKELQRQMSSGIAYYEGELYNVIRQGRGVPAVPLVLVGLAPDSADVTPVVTTGSDT
ncbi:restriction endonuclease [Mesorhizobium sp. BR-1-1-8]|uniref:BglII/BstYI family type II restriction endonuclease n=1 Tax=Mesorhizobium sp. BR-1-1-8 TaxID=2876659 RepID=UPI001CCAE5DB|nr:BglII/BstYI family type II restriction endonuclease [Mesorhizobium sp. BR-1-1-8]MBZ9979761.1 restriction endonuclease [Mesorhizobium sp. BR-1-1-8]